MNILKEVRRWLENDKAPNILWIEGAPGAGKSAIATTLANHDSLKATCATFFCQRDVLRLRDPSWIWRTVAFGLSEKHDAIASSLNSTLKEKGTCPNVQTVEGQLEILIAGLIKFIPDNGRYPVIIIDALDECDAAVGNTWKSLLDSFNSWSKKLSGKFKLIVTSRSHPDIRLALGPKDMSQHIDLGTGDDVSDDSTNDITLFFNKRFATMRDNIGLPSGEPNADEIHRLAEYAAGLFIWAETVIEYVGGRAAGSSPSKRLKNVLNHIEPRTEGEAVRLPSNRIDFLYARILFEAFRLSDDIERETGQKILAAIVLAKEPLRKSDLVELLSANTSKPVDIQSVNSTLQELSSIIPFSDDASDTLRVCHKTVSDFFVDRDRSEKALRTVVERWKPDPQEMKWDGPVSDLVLDCKMENKSLAHACVRLACRNLSLDFADIAVLLTTSEILPYAFGHWHEHLEDAKCDQMADLKNLADAMAFAYGRLERYTDEITVAKDEAVALIRRLDGAINLVSQCIAQGKLLSLVRRHDRLM